MNRSPVFISSRWTEEKRKMQLRNRDSALCKPLNADANPFLRSRRGSYERQEYRPIADSCDIQTAKSAAKPIQVAENAFHTVPEASLGLLNEAGLEDYNYSQEMLSNDPYRLPPQVTSHMYGMAVKNLASTSDPRREIIAPSGLDNESLAAGKPSTITTRGSELQESHRAFLPNKSRTIFTPIDENATLIGSHCSPESYEKLSGGGANTRPCDPHILTADHARQSASVLARHAPASSSEQASRLNNHPQNQPITLISGSGASHESDTLDGCGNLSHRRPTAEDRASFSMHSQPYSHRDIPSNQIMPSSYNPRGNDNDGSGSKALEVQQAYSMDSRLYRPSRVHTWTGYTPLEDIRSRADDIEPSPHATQDELMADILALTGDSPSEERKTIENGGTTFRESDSPSPLLPRKPMLGPTLQDVHTYHAPIPSLDRVPREMHRAQDPKQEETGSRNRERFRAILTPERNQSRPFYLGASSPPTPYLTSEAPAYARQFPQSQQNYRIREPKQAPVDLQESRICAAAFPTTPKGHGERPPRLVRQYVAPQYRVVPATSVRPSKPPRGEVEAVDIGTVCVNSRRGKKRDRGECQLRSLELDDAKLVDSPDSDPQDYGMTMDNSPSPLSNHITNSDPSQMHPYVQASSISPIPQTVVNNTVPSSSSEHTNIHFRRAFKPARRPSLAAAELPQSWESLPAQNATTGDDSFTQPITYFNGYHQAPIPVPKTTKQRPQPYAYGSSFSFSTAPFHGDQPPCEGSTPFPTPRYCDSSTRPRPGYVRRDSSASSFKNSEQVLRSPTPKRAKTGNSRAPPPTTSMPVPDLQDLHATQAEQANAKEEVLKLLRQWTTLDVSKFVENQNRGAGDVQVGAQAAAIIC